MVSVSLHLRGPEPTITVMCHGWEKKGKRIDNRESSVTFQCVMHHLPSSGVDRKLTIYIKTSATTSS